jgi:hypothetical protein
MAAAESSAVPTYIPILVATLPVILSPIVAWALGRSRVSKEAATIDYLNKRLDILDRLNKLHAQLTEGPIRPFLDTEIEYCRAFLHQPPGSAIRLSVTGAPGSVPLPMIGNSTTEPAMRRVYIVIANALATGSARSI